MAYWILHAHHDVVFPLVGNWKGHWKLEWKLFVQVDVVDLDQYYLQVHFPPYAGKMMLILKQDSWMTAVNYRT